MKLSQFSVILTISANFLKKFGSQILSDGQNLRERKSSLSLGKVTNIVIYYQKSEYKTFKHYYERSFELKLAFPNKPSYNRFLKKQ